MSRGFCWGYIEAILQGVIVFWYNCLGIVAHWSVFVQGCRKAFMSRLSRGAYSDSIALSRDAHIIIICPGCKQFFLKLSRGVRRSQRVCVKS